MKKQTTKFCALLLSLLTLMSMITFNSLTVFAAESDKVQNEITGQNTNTEEDEEISFYGATGDTSFEESIDDSIEILNSPSDYYGVLNENDNNATKKLKAANSYPNSVDNSTSEYFPEVRSQESIGSCTAWAQTYYQFTYTMNKQLGRKTTLENTFSPKWSYNFAAGGSKLKGSSYSTIYSIMQTQGTATWDSVPYDDDYLSWSPKENIWQEASKYKVKSYQSLSYGNGNTPITYPNDSDLNTIKAALSNGELLTYSTYVNSWNSKKIKADNRVPANEEYEEQYITTEMSGYNGSHRMTIVGYNDNIWVDINGNDEVEESEMGAFKIVNSWGTYYRNNGFSWVSYDALNKVSSVEGVEANPNRSAIFSIITRVDVEPYDSGSNIYLKYTLNSAARQETPLYIQAKRGDEVISVAVAPYNIVSSENGNYSYDGTTKANDGTMLFDLSNVIPDIDSNLFKDYTWSIRFTDKNNDSNTLTVKNAVIIDQNTGETYKPSTVIPFTLNGSEKTIEFNSNPNNITIYYKGYNTPYIHYQVGSKNWTAVPGYAMTATKEVRDYTHKYTINLGEETYANVCFNDGNGNWDSKNGANYRFEAGTYTYSNGQINTYVNERDLSIKSLDITPTNGRVKVGEYVNMKVNLEHSTGTTMCQYVYVDSDGNETMIYNYSTASRCSVNFTKAGRYTLIVRVKDLAYDPSVVLTAQKTIIVTDEDVLRIKSFDITPSDEKIKVGTYVRMNVTLENAGGMTEQQFLYRDSEGNEKIIYNYSFASGGGVSFPKAGTYTLIVRVRKYMSGSPVVLTAQKTVVVTDELTIYYKGYTTPYIHYQIGNGEWTAVPGYAMTATNEVSGYTHKYTIDLDEPTANICFNDGKGNWDNNNGANYKFEAGTYTYSNGKISRYFDDGSLKIKSFDITPTGGKIKAGDYVDIKIDLKNSSGLTLIQYAYRDSNGYETIIHDYSTASGCSNQFTQPGKYTLIVRVKSNPYSTDIIYAERSVIVS